jgi:putative aldouronate transport system substrate-binding protein
VYSVTYRITAVIAKAAKEGKKEAIARLFEWMSSDEGYYLLGWGVEGVNYTFDKDGIPTAEGIPDPEMAYTQPKGRPFIQLANLIYRYTDAELKATFPTYKTANGRSQSALDFLRDFQTRAWTEDTGADTLPLPNDDLKRFYEQGVAEFITGRRVLNQANWKAFVADFDRLGGKAWEDEARAYAQENGLLL